MGTVLYWASQWRDLQKYKVVPLLSLSFFWGGGETVIFNGEYVY